MRDAIGRLADRVVEVDEPVREEIGLPPNTFEFVTEEMTEEEKTELLERLEAEKQDWMKKNKKKPLGEEEEKEQWAEFTKKMIDSL